MVLVDEELASIAAKVTVPVVTVTAAMQADSRVLAGRDAEPVPMRRRRPEDLFRLMSTSGTTDRPTGVMHAYSNLYWKCMDHVADLQLTRHDRLCEVGPLYHVGAFDPPGIARLWVRPTNPSLRAF